jgi:hypothetical protein
MRAQEMIAAVQWLAAQSDVDDAKISAYADGASGVALLHAAVLENGFGKSPSSQRLAPTPLSSMQTYIVMLPSRLFQACYFTMTSMI